MAGLCEGSRSLIPAQCGPCQGTGDGQVTSGTTTIAQDGEQRGSGCPAAPSSLIPLRKLHTLESELLLTAPSAFAPVA